MFLSTPALAADKPSQDVSIPKPKSALPKADRPAAGVHAAPGLRSGIKAAGTTFDLDGDKVDDNIVRLDDGTTLVWLSTNGKFQQYTISQDNPDEKSKDILTPGNLDGTDDPEVLTLSTTGTLSLYHSTSTSGTSYSTWSGQGWQIYNKVIAPGDVTGDGKPDLLARTYSGDLYLYQGTGNGSSPFRARVLVGGGWSMFDQLVGVGDINKDGIGDVVARTPSGDLYFYAGKGSATAPLAARTKIGSGWNTYNQIIAAGDWNGDGLGDLLGRTASGDLYYYYADGSGNFLARKKNGSGFEPVDLFSGSGANPYWGKASLVGLDNGGTLYWYGVLHNGQLGGRAKISDTGGWAGAHVGYASSLDADGYADVLEQWNGALYNHSYGTDSAVSNGWSKYNLFLGPGDLNDDGKGDVLARDTSGNLYLYRGNGTGGSLASPLKIGGGWNGYDKIVGAGDLNGDGRADIVARTPSGTLYLYRGTGNSTSPFASKVKIGTGWQQYNKLVSPGDIDGDNQADLLAVNSKGELYRYSSTGQGQFKARAKLGTGWNTYKNLY
ncbi:VCBS repeat-containing protein [Streptomyces sp. NPDC021356]|uniref:FG-GAP repeat domain-containing protein n=1 Tax=Streptomyces sp. NPDC021356 TaxID=3154900 RepID=UPI0033F1981E